MSQKQKVDSKRVFVLTGCSTQTPHLSLNLHFLTWKTTLLEHDSLLQSLPPPSSKSSSLRGCLLKQMLSTGTLRGEGWLSHLHFATSWVWLFSPQTSAPLLVVSIFPNTMSFIIINDDCRYWTWQRLSHTDYLFNVSSALFLTTHIHLSLKSRKKAPYGE